MSRIDDLIRELCPQGVQRRTLSRLATIGTGSSDKKDASLDGSYPFYVRSKEVFRSTTFEFDETAILIPGEGGIGEIFHFNEGPYALHQRAYRVAPFAEDLEPRFLYFYMVNNFRSHILSKAVSATVSSIRKPMIESFLVATPPLEVQREIVSILDKFTQLEAELEAELEARKTQYEVTRDRLLEFSGDLSAHPMGEKIRELCPEGVIFRSIGEVTEVNRGSSISKLETTEGNVPVIAGGQKPAYWHSEPNRYGENIVVAGSGAYAGFVSYWNQPIWASDSFTVTGQSKLVLTKFVFYWLKNMQQQLHSLKRGSGVPHVYAKDVAKILIAVPPLEIQKGIISILDKLDDLVNDITYGLPAEIAARRKQYEYYRNKLLTFKEMDAA